MLQVFGAVHVGLLKPTPSPVGFGTNGVASWKDKGPLEVLSVPPVGVGAAGTGDAAGAILLAADFFLVAACPLKASKPAEANAQRAKKRRVGRFMMVDCLHFGGVPVAGRIASNNI